MSTQSPAIPPAVLVVDDNDAVRAVVNDVLTTTGVEVVEARDGLEGLQAFADHGNIAMVLVDMHMPRMNGLEMLRALKGDPANAELPILLLTVTGTPSEVEEAKKAGASGWIVKPFRLHTLLDAVQRYIHDRPVASSS